MIVRLLLIAITRSLTIDFVCRPHATDHCWELGYVEDGKLFGRDFGTCNDKVMREFNLAVKVENGRGTFVSH